MPILITLMTVVIELGKVGATTLAIRGSKLSGCLSEY